MRMHARKQSVFQKLNWKKHKMQPIVAKILTRVGGATKCIIDKVSVSKVRTQL